MKHVMYLVNSIKDRVNYVKLATIAGLLLFNVIILSLYLWFG